MRASVVVFAAGALVASADPARACGGLFCSSVQSTPVDQTAERILFEVNEDGTITATVEVRYTGDPREFSWIVPIPETPTDLGVAPAALLPLLDAATAPTFVPPSVTCRDALRPNAVPVFGCARAAAAPDPAPPPVQVAPAADPGVAVEEIPSVGPYDDIVVVDSEDPEALVAWLTEHQYLVTDAMKPLIAQYVEEGQKFLALRLAPDAGVQDIVPLRFTCPGEAPHIPLRLTGLASVPEMSILVFVAGAVRYQPTNYRGIELPTDEVRVDPQSGLSNYYPLVSRRLDEAGGTAFLTERAGASELVLPRVQTAFAPGADLDVARDELQLLLGRRGYLTRLYTRMNPEEMVEDPLFVAAGGRAVSGTHDLSDRVVDVCRDDAAPPACGLTYCGHDARCATTELGDGCACAPGQVARAVSLPQGQGVFCQEQGADFLGDVLVGDADPCAASDCGEGRCVAVNGAATCACDPGAAAVPHPRRGGAVMCMPMTAIFDVDGLLWPGSPSDPAATRFAEEGSCRSASKEPLTGLSFLAFAFAAVCGFARLLRRRR